MLRQLFHRITDRAADLLSANPKAVEEDDFDDSRFSTIPCVSPSNFRDSLFSRSADRNTVDDAPIHTGRDTRDCQPTGRAAGEYWHLFSHRYLLSSAKQRPTLSHYHEQLRHTDHGIENRVYGALHSSLPSSISLTNPHPWIGEATCTLDEPARGRAFDTHYTLRF